MAAGPIVIHSAAHARAALSASEATGVRVTLTSAPGAAAFVGPIWFRDVVALAQAAYPQARCLGVLDCGDRAGDALAALRAGVKAIALTASPSVRRRVGQIARQSGAHLVTQPRGSALDLLDVDDPLAACQSWLQNSTR